MPEYDEVLYSALERSGIEEELEDYVQITIKSDQIKQLIKLLREIETFKIENNDVIKISNQECVLLTAAVHHTKAMLLSLEDSLNTDLESKSLTFYVAFKQPIPEGNVVRNDIAAIFNEPKVKHAIRSSRPDPNSEKHHFFCTLQKT